EEGVVGGEWGDQVGGEGGGGGGYGVPQHRALQQPDLHVSRPRNRCRRQPWSILEYSLRYHAGVRLSWARRRVLFRRRLRIDGDGRVRKRQHRLASRRNVVVLREVRRGAVVQRDECA